MNISIISLFPEMFTCLEQYGVAGRAIQSDLINLSYYNPREYSADKHRTVDDRPYGGGPGMVMMAEPISKAIEAALEQASQHTELCNKLPAHDYDRSRQQVIYLSPQGKKFDHQAAQKLSQLDSLILLAGRYEGVDERVIEHYVDQEFSIGDYVLSGGELPAMVMIDAIIRWLPGSLGNQESALQDSFVEGVLDCPHYTRPEVILDKKVPSVLLSGDHAAIESWRKQQAMKRTRQRRPELLERVESDDDLNYVADELKNHKKE